MKNNIVKKKSFDFAIRIVKLTRILQEDKRDFVISKQLLHCATPVGACVRESEHAESDSDFIHKLQIGLKEANETEYWLDLLYATQYLNEKEYESIIADCKEILKLLISIIKTKKENIKNESSNKN